MAVSSALIRGKFPGLPWAAPLWPPAMHCPPACQACPRRQQGSQLGCLQGSPWEPPRVLSTIHTEGSTPRASEMMPSNCSSTTAVHTGGGSTVPGRRRRQAAVSMLLLLRLAWWKHGAAWPGNARVMSCTMRRQPASPPPGLPPAPAHLDILRHLEQEGAARRNGGAVQRQPVQPAAQHAHPAGEVSRFALSTFHSRQQAASRPTAPRNARPPSLTHTRPASPGGSPARQTPRSSNSSSQSCDPERTRQALQADREGAARQAEPDRRGAVLGAARRRR